MRKLIAAIIRILDSERDAIYRQGLAAGFNEGRAAAFRDMAAGRRYRLDELEEHFGEAVDFDSLMRGEE